MKLGFSEKIITPHKHMEMVGFIPSRISDSVEKDLKVKTIAILEKDKVYVWLTADSLGLSLFFKEQLLEKLKANNLNVVDLQMFATHTHSAPRCLKKAEFYLEDKFNDEKAYLDLLVNQSFTAIKESIKNAQQFSYKVNKAKIKDFQKNRINKDSYYNDDLLVIEVSFSDDKLLIYSFSGHPTILNDKSTAISPDYIGEVSRLLAKDLNYKKNIFFNAPCGDISSRYTRKESSITELKRLSKIAFKHIKEALSNLSEEKSLKNYKVRHLPYKLALKTFDSEKVAKEKLKKAEEDFENAKQDKKRYYETVMQGARINLEHSQKNSKDDFYQMNIYIVDIDDYHVVNIAGEIFSSLTKSLKEDDKTWVLSLSDEYKTYLVDKSACEQSTYEALSSVYKKGEAEKLISYLKKLKWNKAYLWYNLVGVILWI